MNQNKFNLEYSYDIETDSIFIKIINDYDYEESIELEEGIILDFDKNGNPVALEILDLSKLFAVDKSYFNHIDDIRMEVNINHAINLKLKFCLSDNDKKCEQNFDTFVKNNVNLPEITTIAFC
ncbi:MAG: DUF2283 domain-containing protein [Methanobrevibacter sp.]|nr:DUF2283 domain-containing protein [Methanobrevibacter sp.]